MAEAEVSDASLLKKMDEGVAADAELDSIRKRDLEEVRAQMALDVRQDYKRMRYRADKRRKANHEAAAKPTIEKIAAVHELNNPPPPKKEEDESGSGLPSQTIYIIALIGSLFGIYYIK